MAQLSLCLLGPFQVHWSGIPLTDFESDKARALLAYLAVEMAQPHPREQVATLLWPHWSANGARANLRATLSNLRKTLRERGAQTPYLLANRQTIQFNQTSNHYLDVQDFTQCLKALSTAAQSALDARRVTNLQQAVALCRKPFLDGFYLDECAEFEEWLLLTRERLQQQLLHALQRLAQIYEQQGDYTQARQYAQRQVEIDPLQEQAHQQLMRNLALLGERTAALQAYETYRRLLRHELGVEPDAETVTLHRQIQRGQLIPVQPQAYEQESAARAPVILSLQDQRAVTRHNLPAPMTSFVGRDDERTKIGQWLRQKDVRLVTLTGPGGVGKTRLALETAQTLLADFVDGIYLVELAPLRAADTVLMALAQPLGVQESGSQTLFQAVQARLRDKQMLLVLDNFEHVMAAADLVADLLTSAWGVKMLITSREALRLYGEYAVPITPLALPEDAMDIVKVGARDAVQLLIQRSQAFQPDFQINENNARAIAQICIRLDGLPLAIELAAARLRYDSPQGLWTSLNQQGALNLLHHGPRNVAPKHKTLHNALAWSYDLLGEGEQLVFRRLAVFAGGCTVDALVAVCSSGDVDLHGADTDRIQAILNSLFDKSLIQRRTLPNGQDRYTLLETIREYGLRQLVTHGEEATACRSHTEYYLALAEAVDADFRRGGASTYLAPIRREQDNLRAAMKWTIDQGETALALRLSGVLTNLWESEGFFSEGLEWSQKAIQLARHKAPTPTMLKALWYTGFLALGLGELATARPLFEQCLHGSRQLKNYHWMARSLSMLAGLSFLQGDYAEMTALDEESLYIRRAQAVDWSLGMALQYIGGRLAKLDDRQRAHRYLEEGLAILRKMGHQYGCTIALTAMGRLCIQEGNYDRTRQVLDEAQQIAQATGHSSNYASVLSLSVEFAIAEKNYAEAQTLATAALSLYNRAGQKIRLVEMLDLFARLFVCQQNALQAVYLAGAATTLRRSLGLVLPPTDQAQFNHTLAQVRRQLHEQAITAAWAAGAALTLDAAVAAIHEG
ncbi:MAG: BTAD domain-containing putative transcriptional regulator [Caldilineaceae bacterium]